MSQGLDINTVVVPLDGSDLSERALMPAADLARLNDAGLCLVTAVEDAHEQDEKLAYLNETAARDALHASGTVSTEAKVDPHTVDAIAKTAADDTVICMATSTTLFHISGYVGSMAEKVLRRTGQPTVLVGPEAEINRAFDVDRVVVPLDGSDLAEVAIDIGVAWADLLEVPIWLVEVQTPRDAKAVQAAVGSEARFVESAYLRNLARDHAASGVDFEWDTLRDKDPAEGILDFTDDGLVVMTTHGRTGLRRIVMGSVATHVAREARHPVVVVCPGPIADDEEDA